MVRKGRESMTLDVARRRGARCWQTGVCSCVPVKVRLVFGAGPGGEVGVVACTVQPSVPVKITMLGDGFPGSHAAGGRCKLLSNFASKYIALCGRWFVVQLVCRTFVLGTSPFLFALDTCCVTRGGSGSEWRIVLVATMATGRGNTSSVATLL